jgi:hypothetical protein
VSDTVYGTVININAYGATVRLEGGELASAPAGDVEAHRGDYDRGMNSRRLLPFQLHGAGRRPMVTIAPQIVDHALDEQIADFWKTTESWDADAEGRPQHERHFLQKKKRAVLFESKHREQ